MVMYAPKFTWLSTQRRNLWYHLGRNMEQFDDVRNILRNPDYKGTELGITENSINTTCLEKNQLNVSFIITEGASSDFKDGIDVRKVFDFIESLNETFWSTGVSLNVKIHHVTRVENPYKAMYHLYRWVVKQNKRHINYDIQTFNFDNIKPADVSRKMVCKIVTSCRSKRSFRPIIDKLCEDKRVCFNINISLNERELLRVIEEKALKSNQLKNAVFDDKMINIIITDANDDSNPAFTALKTQEAVKIHVVDNEKFIPSMTDNDVIQTPRTDFTSKQFNGLFFELLNEEVERLNV
uniref:Uncharacterized protein n=1 Tax=Clytia hemisphaerica TaxID=252671 RepID=A0A7M5UPS7_9CNID